MEIRTDFWDRVDKRKEERGGARPAAPQKCAAAPDLFSIDADLENVTNTLHLIVEELESEGYQPEDKYDATAAYIFIKRLPYYLSALHLIISIIGNIQEQISE